MVAASKCPMWRLILASLYFPMTINKINISRTINEVMQTILLISLESLTALIVIFRFIKAKINEENCNSPRQPNRNATQITLGFLKELMTTNSCNVPFTQTNKRGNGSDKPVHMNVALLHCTAHKTDINMQKSVV